MNSISPHRGVGDITFGMTRDQVETVVGRVPRRAKRSAFDAAEIDFFDGFAAYYDASGKCCALEFSRGGVSISYDGYELFAHPAAEARAWARSRDQDMDDKDGFVSTALGLSMYAPAIDDSDLDADERAEPAQSFLVFRPGYYEDERKRRELVKNAK